MNLTQCALEALHTPYELRYNVAAMCSICHNIPGVQHLPLGSAAVQLRWLVVHFKSQPINEAVLWCIPMGRLQGSRKWRILAADACGAFLWGAYKAYILFFSTMEIIMLNHLCPVLQRIEFLQKVMSHKQWAVRVAPVPSEVTDSNPWVLSPFLIWLRGQLSLTTDTWLLTQYFILVKDGQLTAWQAANTADVSSSQTFLACSFSYCSGHVIGLSLSSQDSGNKWMK
jgi:hypothetical protein